MMPEIQAVLLGWRYSEKHRNEGLKDQGVFFLQAASDWLAMALVLDKLENLLQPLLDTHCKMEGYLLFLGLTGSHNKQSKSLGFIATTNFLFVSSYTKEAVWSFRD